jgi:hypothetical protein
VASVSHTSQGYPKSRAALPFLFLLTSPIKALNRALLLLQDFEFTYPPSTTSISWTLITSSDVSAPNNTPPVLQPAFPPLPPSILTTNDFANSTPTDINNFIRSNNHILQSLDLTVSNWVIIDQKGIDSSTCLVADQVYDMDEMRMTDEFTAARLPYEWAWSMFANLDIANMGFEDWVVEEKGMKGDGTYEWVGEGAMGEQGREVVERKEKALEALREQGDVD